MDLADLQDAAREALALVTAMSNTVSAAAARIRAAEAQESLSKWIWDAQSKIYANSGISAETLKENERDYVAAQVDTEQARFTWNAMGALWALSRLAPIYFERRLKWAVMTSPIDGIVLNRYHENAATLMAGAPLLDIGNPDELEVTAGILSEDATAIKPGAEVDIFGTALGTNTLQGRVKRVDPRAFMKVSSLGVEEQRVNVTVAIKAGELARLRAGGRELGVDFRVRVRIYTAAARMR
jgi:HlyD family secretion protein